MNVQVTGMPEAIERGSAGRQGELSTRVGD